MPTDVRSGMSETYAPGSRSERSKPGAISGVPSVQMVQSISILFISAASNAGGVPSIFVRDALGPAVPRRVVQLIWPIFVGRRCPNSRPVRSVWMCAGPFRSLTNDGLGPSFISLLPSKHVILMLVDRTPVPLGQHACRYSAVHLISPDGLDISLVPSSPSCL